MGKIRNEIQVQRGNESSLFKMMMKGLMGTNRAREEQL
jgi:hypothetical protein